MSNSQRFAVKLAGVFLANGVALIIAGRRYLAHDQVRARADANEMVSAFVPLRLRQAVEWLEERLSDARFLAYARPFAQDVQRFLADPGSQSARGAVLVEVGRKIPGTSWTAVARSDRKELHAPLQRQMAVMLLVEGALMLTSATLIGFLWHRRGAHYSQRELALKREHAAKHKAHEEALRESEERFRTLVNSIPQLAWIARPDGDVFWYNERWYEYSGTTLHQMNGRGWEQVHDPQVLPKVREQWRSSIATGQPFEMESPLRGADGQFRPFLTRVMPFKDSRGKVVLWFGTSTDVMDIVKARETLAQSRLELERLVRERTSQLAEANANLRTFTDTAAHDLRAPLRAIHGLCSLAVAQYGGKLDATGRSLLGRVVKSAEQMSRLLDDLLEYSKLSQAEVRLGRVKLADAVGRALALLEADVRGKNALVTVNEQLPDVLGHPATVVLLINNLVSNALKFSRLNVQPRIAIGVEERSNFIRLWVRDNGLGIAPEDLEKVFGVFQRLHDKEEYPGTGLGLAIVRKGAERMGGRAGVESEVGKGSLFWIELKAVD